MKKLKMEVGELWGSKTEFHPYLIDYSHGDGGQIIWIEYMDDRPRYYIVRVDSDLNIDGDDFLWTVLAEINDVILEESFEFMDDKQRDEFEQYGYFDTCDREWPIPPLEMASGTEWGKFRCPIVLDDLVLEQVG